MAEKKLNPKQELFCKIFASEQEFFGNGVQSYAKAYGTDLTTKGGYATAKVNSHKLLTNANILAFIDKIMDIYVNDQVVDKELAFVVLQKSDFGAKVAAIREYNKLKQRIIDKSETTIKDESKQVSEEELDGRIENKLKEFAKIGKRGTAKPIDGKGAKKSK
jgi:phage terminase small subunit